MKHRATRSVRASQLAIVMAISLLVGGQAPAAEPGSETQLKGLEQLYTDFGISAAVRAGDFLYIGGIAAVDGEGSVMGPYDGKKQFEVVYERINELLKAHGASAKNVISETIYITGLQFMVEGDDIRRAFYVDAKAAFPTAAAVQVVALTYPALVLEVEIVAYLGD